MPLWLRLLYAIPCPVVCVYSARIGLRVDYDRVYVLGFQIGIFDPANHYKRVF